MERYLHQLRGDIAFSTTNVSLPYIDPATSIWDIPTPEEEESVAITKNLQELTGLTYEMLPPAGMLNDEQVKELLHALTTMLDAYNCHFVLQIEVPERLQYETIRCNFSQEVKILNWNMGFFEMCKPGTQHGQCTLNEYCQCKFYDELFAQFEDEDLTPEEERARMLDIEVRHIKRKYDDDWQKYYPYHLDKNYDDEDGHPYDYGVGFDNEAEDD